MRKWEPDHDNNGVFMKTWVMKVKLEMVQESCKQLLCENIEIRGRQIKSLNYTQNWI